MLHSHATFNSSAPSQKMTVMKEDMDISSLQGHHITDNKTTGTTNM
jgi:hypothetical protein